MRSRDIACLHIDTGSSWFTQFGVWISFQQTEKRDGLFVNGDGSVCGAQKEDRDQSETYRVLDISVVNYDE